jgi:hypothetical protein
MNAKLQSGETSTEANADNKSFSTAMQTITTVHEMLAFTSGQVVTLPPFGVDMPCVVKLKRLSLLGLIKSGRIPNQLMATATSLFNSGKMTSDDKNNKDSLKSTSEMLELFAKTSLVEPTYQELQDVGVELTDLQLAAIFAHSQSGVKDLERFPNV